MSGGPETSRVSAIGQFDGDGKHNAHFDFYWRETFFLWGLSAFIHHVSRLNNEQTNISWSQVSPHAQFKSWLLSEPEELSEQANH